MTCVRGLAPGTVLALGFTAFVIYAFPGYMSTDSAGQLWEARTGVFSAAHPPLMAAEWWLLDRIISGPVLMLLLQQVLDRARAAWVACGILLFPPVLVVMAVIWKDAQMAAFLVAGLAALVQPRLRTRLVGLVLLGAAASLRYNAFAAAAPLVGFVFEWRGPIRWWKRLVLCAAAVVVLIGLMFGVTKLLATKTARLTPMFADIVGTLAYGDDQPDAVIRDELAGVPLAIDHGFIAHARHLQDLHGGWRVMTGDEPFFKPPQTDAQWDAVEQAWKRIVRADPWAYVAYHAALMARMMRLGTAVDDVPTAVWNNFLEDRGHLQMIQHDASFSTLQDWIGIGVFYRLEALTPLFRPYLYAVIALLVLVLFARERVTVALLASGLLYEASFFPVGAEADYRYSHWLICATCIACVWVFVRRLRRPA